MRRYEDLEVWQRGHDLAVRVAAGSAAELDYYWHLAADLSYLSESEASPLHSDTRLLRVKLTKLAHYLDR